MSREQLESTKKLFFVLLGVDIAVTIVIALSNFWGLGVLDDIQTGRREATPSILSTMNFWDGFGKLAILTLCAVGVGLVKWLSACYRFAKEALGATGFKNEGWSGIGWVFPVFHFFKPYQVINEIYKAGSRTYVQSDDWKKENGSGLLLTWWIFYAITHLIVTLISKQLWKDFWRDDLSLKQSIGLIEASTAICVYSIIIAGLWFWVANVLTKRLLDRSVSLANTQPAQYAHQVPIAAPIVTMRPIPLADKAQPTSNPHQTAMSAQTSLPPSVAQQAPMIDEDSVYEIVAIELESGKTDKGLWTRLFAELDGDEKKVKIAYIKQRAEKIMVAERARILELNRQVAEEAAKLENLRLKRLTLREQLALVNRTDEIRAKLKSLSDDQTAAAFRIKVTTNQLEAVAIMLDENPLLVATIDSADDSPLHKAVKEQYVAMARLLVEKGALTDVKNMFGEFKWLGSYGKCSATFRGQEKQFASGKDFASWFMAEVVSFLIKI